MISTGSSLAPVLAILLGHAPGWQAPDTTVDSALAGLAPGQVVIVEVSADWCPPCHQLKNEVLDTPAGLALVEGDVGVLVDYESEHGQDIKRRYGVLVLPTTLVLDRAGVEIGRVEGYPGPAEWIESVRDAKAGRFGVEALAAAVRAAPGDAHLRVQLAQAELVRGDERRALAALDRVIAGRRKDLDGAAHAARVKGRWLLRVKEDARAGVAHFRAMLARFAGTPHEAHFRYWAAIAWHERGDDAAALALFEAWARAAPASREPLATQADFMVQHGYPLEQTEAVVRAALAQAGDDADLHYLLARVLARRGDRAGEAAAIERALALAPEAAIFANYKKRLAPAP